MRINPFGRRFLAVAAVFEVFLAASGLAQRGNPEMKFAGQSIDEMVAEYMRDNGVSGMSVAIVQAPYITRATGFGLADKERRTLVSGNTMFDIGPMRNAFTAVAIMQLVEAGKLSLDKTANDFLPGSSPKSVRELLRMPSAYPELEKLAEKVSGKSYETFIEDGQFRPLGLKHTSFGSKLSSLAAEKMPAGEKHKEFLKSAELIDPTEPAAGYSGNAAAPRNDHGIYSTAHDISIWDVGLAGEILIKSPELRAILYKPAEGVPTTGPWYFPGHSGLMVSMGEENGFSSLLSRFTHPDELVCVTLLANAEGLDLSQLARKIAGAYDPKIGPPPETAAMRVQQSPYPVKMTIDRLESILKEKGVGIIARVDHSAAAKSANLDLPATEELIFGNPAQGTLLMQGNPAVVTDLPLRAAAWEKDGEVWLAASDPVEIAEKHGITTQAALALKMREAIDAALLKAVSPE